MSTVCMSFLFFHRFCSSLFAFQLTVRTGHGEGVSKQKLDRHGQRDGGGLTTGKNVRPSFMDDPLL